VELGTFPMMRRWRSRYWFPAAVCLFGIAVLVAISYASLLLGTDFATARFSLLAAVILISILGSYVCAVVLSVVAVGCLSYFFTPPLFFCCGIARRFVSAIGLSHDLNRHHRSFCQAPQGV
jgi:hypothetical protein